MALLIVGFGLVTWAILWLASLRHSNAVFFVAVQFLLLAGALPMGG